MKALQNLERAQSGIPTKLKLEFHRAAEETLSAYKMCVCIEQINGKASGTLQNQDTWRIFLPSFSFSGGNLIIGHPKDEKLAGGLPFLQAEQGDLFNDKDA